jgi:hypothetical protein
MLARAAYGPGRGVADAAVDDLTSQDDLVTRGHDIFDRGCVVPPTDVHDVDLADVKLLSEASAETRSDFAWLPEVFA